MFDRPKPTVGYNANGKEEEEDDDDDDDDDDEGSTFLRNVDINMPYYTAS